MPDEIQYDASATPAQFTNNADIVIEQGTHVRVKIIGLRTEVGEMWAIGSINGDFLGLVPPGHVVLQSRVVILTVLPPQLSAGIGARQTGMARPLVKVKGIHRCQCVGTELLGVILG